MLEIETARGLACSATGLPIGSDSYNQHGWVEIEIRVELEIDLPPCTDAIAIRDVTLGPT